MNSQIVSLGNCRFEVLSRDEKFVGLGKIWIGETLVRSGQLPLRPYWQSFAGWDLKSLQLRDVQQNGNEIRVRTEAVMQPLEVKLMRDHSFDPIHETNDWNGAQSSRAARLDIVLRPAHDTFNGVEFDGFDYHYEYTSPETPLFYVLDKASWELGGNIEGATAYSQSSCSPPVATFEKDTSWSTEGILHFLVEAGNQNPIMTHNLPRWASHGSFDFQFRENQTLIGVFERVELIRSILQRDAGKPELKTFDKHIFDEALEYSTVPKKILRNSQPKSVVGQQNVWTWIHCEVEERARQEYGLKEEPIIPRIACNFWNNFTVADYYKDLLPATEAIGCHEIFVDNLKKSAMTERAPMPDVFNWNMCCGHEFEISEKLGGNDGVKKLVEDCESREINVVSWTNNTQALSSPVNNTERDDKGWFVLLEDSRLKYGGAYAAVMSVLDLGVDGAREYFVQTHRKIKEQTGLGWYLYDSFYNLGFMPVSYRDMKPRTIWRGCLQAVKELQDAGVHFLIESFGPFGTPQHGHPSSYNFDTLFICYRVGLGNDYSTVPVSNSLFVEHPDDAGATYLTLANMAIAALPLFKDKDRIDQTWTPQHKRAMDDYHANAKYMTTRYMQEDGQGVLWHDREQTRATLWNYANRSVALPGKVRNATTEEDLPPQQEYSLRAFHTYVISECELPTQLT